MHDARSRSEWNHTASLMALLANANSGKGGRKFTVDDFHPFARRGKATDMRLPASALKGIFGL